MAKNKKNAKTPEAAADDKPLPEEPERPGTSGTEMLLTTNRRTASEQYKAAERAENAYKAKKRSAGARQHGSEAKSHFKQSAHHLKEGTKSFVKMFIAVPWMLRGWKQTRREADEKKAMERDLKRKEKLEKRLAKSEGDAVSEN